MKKQRFILMACYCLLPTAIWVPTYGTTSWSCSPWNGDHTSEIHRLAHLCYVRTEFKMAWGTAEKYCQKYGGILTKETSKNVHEFFKRTVLAKHPDKSNIPCFWIGLTDNESPGVWRWSDGEAVGRDYTNWSLIGILVGWLETRFYDCAALCPGADIDGVVGWLWEKKSCSAEFPVICQMAATAKAKPKKRRITRSKTAMYVFELTNQRGVRLTSDPDWSTKAFTTTSCARHCQNLGERCHVFNYNLRSRECRVFSSERVISGGWEPGEGWSTWKTEIRDKY